MSRSVYPLVLFILVFCLTSSCTPKVRLDRSMPLQIAVEDFQPLAFFPIPEAPAYPESGTDADSFIALSFTNKGYRVIDAVAVSKILNQLELSSEEIFSDPSGLRRFKEESGAKLLLIGNFLDYRIRKGHLGEKTYQVWDGVTYEYQSLPTYYKGTFQARLKLRLMNPENGHVVWTAEGSAEGSNFSAKTLIQELIQELLGDFPSLNRPPTP
jgi:hypothetical protein